MIATRTDHWALVCSGQKLGRYSCVKDAARMIRNLHPQCELESTHITDMIYEIKVTTPMGVYFYTVLWSLE